MCFCLKVLTPGLIQLIYPIILAGMLASVVRDNSAALFQGSDTNITNFSDTRQYNTTHSTSSTFSKSLFIKKVCSGKGGLAVENMPFIACVMWSMLKTVYMNTRQ